MTSLVGHLHATPVQDPDSAIREAFDLYVAAVNAKNPRTDVQQRFRPLRRTPQTHVDEHRGPAGGRTPGRPARNRVRAAGKADPAKLRSGTGHSIMSFMIEQGLLTVNTSSKYVKADGTTTVTQTTPRLTTLVLNDDRATADQVITESLTAQFGAARAAELRKPIN